MASIAERLLMTSCPRASPAAHAVALAPRPWARPPAATGSPADLPARIAQAERRPSAAAAEEPSPHLHSDRHGVRRPAVRVRFRVRRWSVRCVGRGRFLRSPSSREIEPRRESPPRYDWSLTTACCAMRIRRAEVAGWWAIPAGARTIRGSAGRPGSAGAVPGRRGGALRRRWPADAPGSPRIRYWEAGQTSRTTRIRAGQKAGLGYWGVRARPTPRCKRAYPAIKLASPGPTSARRLPTPSPRTAALTRLLTRVARAGAAASIR
jgi:hypothetical protein